MSGSFILCFRVCVVSSASSNRYASVSWWAGALVKDGEMRGESRQGLRCFGALWCFGGWVAVEEALGCC